MEIYGKQGLDRLRAEKDLCFLKQSEVAGQTVFHFQLHLIPRYKDADNSNVLTTGHVSFSDEEMKEICESLRLN